jgi:lipoprotein-anchoring transpeptidase ErfK/SrfK
MRTQGIRRLLGRTIVTAALAAGSFGLAEPRALATTGTTGSGTTSTTKSAPKPITRAVAKLVEKQLSALGYPVGVVDGAITNYSKQALCAWRDTHGLPGGRAGLTTDLVASVLAGKAAPMVKRSDGLYVDKTCQVLFQVVKGKYKRIVRVSTAGPGHDTPNGTGHVWKKTKGWHQSTLYPDAYMYDPLYFLPNRPAIALHGSVRNSLVHTYPASHGCVRVLRPTIAKIFAETPIGTPVTVFGSY